MVGKVNKVRQSYLDLERVEALQWRQKHKRIKWIIALTAAAIAFKCLAQEAAQTFDVLIAAETAVENGGAVAAGLTPLQTETASYCARRNCSGIACAVFGRYRIYTATYSRTRGVHAGTGAKVCSAWTQMAISSKKSKTCDKSKPCGEKYVLSGTCDDGQAVPDVPCR